MTIKDLDDLAPTDPTDPAPRPGTWSQLRPVVLRLHFYAGILIAPFLLVAAVTGLAYTAAPQIESIVYSDQLEVTPSGSQVPLSEQVVAARAAHPDGDITGVTPPVNQTSSTRVVFTDETVPDDYAMTVFVDPYTGETLGEVKSFGQWLGVRAWLDDLHRNLHLGDVGRHYSELAASWLWVVVLGGLSLWVSKRRRDQRLRRLVVPDRATRGRQRSLSWHGAIGTSIALGLLLLAGSGLTWSNYAGAKIGDVRSSFDWSTPVLETSTASESDLSATPETEEHDHGASAEKVSDQIFTSGAGIDGVLATAQEQGLRTPLDIIPPSAGASTWTVAENKRSAPTQYDAITVAPDSGEVVDRVDQGEWPFMAKMTDWVIGAHMGILFGIVNQLVLAALAIGLIAVIVQGYRMWWQRRPTRSAGPRMGRPAPRGALRRISAGPLALVLLTVVVSAYFVPLLGISLAAFLMVDLMVAARARRGLPAER